MPAKLLTVIYHADCADGFGAAYAEQVRVFVHNILVGSQPEVTGEDARVATAIGIAATLSFDEDRPVLVSEVDR